MSEDVKYRTPTFEEFVDGFEYEERIYDLEGGRSWGKFVYKSSGSAVNDSWIKLCINAPETIIRVKEQQI